MLKPVLLALILSASVMFAEAQAASPSVTSNTEYDIGVDCPVAQTLTPDGTVLWVLIEGCFTGHSTLKAFKVADGSPIETVRDFSADLVPLKDGYIDSFTNPMAFTDGVISIHYSDAETYDPRTLVIGLEGKAVEPIISDEALTELLRSFTEYPEATVYNADHTQAATVSATDLHVLDLVTGEDLFSLPLEPETYNAYPSFSSDGQALYVAQFDDPDDMTNYAATLYAYSLPDGDLLGSFAVPSAVLWVSPDGKYAAVENGSNDGTTSDLSVVDLVSGSVSEPFSLYEPPGRLMTCVNDGRDMSDVDFPTSGRLTLTRVNWLPDSSTFVFTRSYGGEAAGGGRPCAFNYSRLNRFEIGD